jgi:hypothetical protein
MARREIGRIARAFDPDHVGAPVAELPYADRAGAGMSEIEDG